MCIFLPRKKGTSMHQYVLLAIVTPMHFIIFNGGVFDIFTLAVQNYATELSL